MASYSHDGPLMMLCVGTPGHQRHVRFHAEGPAITSRALGRSVIVVLDHHGAAVMVLVDRTRNNDGVGAMMPAAVIVESHRTMVAVMQSLTVLVDDPDVAVVAMVSPDDYVGFGRRSDSRQPDGKRQSAHDH
ncbi:hypothetical protein ACVINZ_005861 [Mesorhizobium jarvisii]